MITRAGYLTTRYGGYLHREVPEEDAELSHVGPDTPCGEYLRRFWQPICFSDELKDLPHRVKILALGADGLTWGKKMCRSMSTGRHCLGSRRVLPARVGVYTPRNSGQRAEAGNPLSAIASPATALG